MSEEKTPAMAAFAKFHERVSGAPLLMPDSWDMQPEAVRADWEAAAEAVAPAYAMLLNEYRALIDQASRYIAAIVPENGGLASALRERAGLEPLAAPATGAGL